MLIENLLTVFNYQQIQDTITLMLLLDRNNLSLEDLKSYIKKKEEQIKNRDFKHKLIGKTCLECKSIMSLFTVNNLPGNRVGKGFKSQWYCSKCGYAIYNKESINLILEKLLLKKNLEGRI